MEEKVKDVVEMIDTLLSDPTVPRNVKRALEEAKNRLLGEGEISVRASAAIYSIEPVSDDANLPTHARTQIWAILSALEGIKHD